MARERTEVLGGIRFDALRVIWAGCGAGIAVSTGSANGDGLDLQTVARLTCGGLDRLDQRRGERDLQTAAR